MAIFFRFDPDHARIDFAVGCMKPRGSAGAFPTGSVLGVTPSLDGVVGPVCGGVGRSADVGRWRCFVIN